MAVGIDTKELRLDMPADYMRALDAFALSEDTDRSKYVAAILIAHIETRLLRHSLADSMLRGNPLLSECERRRVK